MSDYNSSLPVRTENAGDVIAKIADSLVPSQQLAVNADGSLNITDNGGSLTVDATNLDIRDLAFATDKVDVTGSDVTATVTATDLDIRDLAFATDKVDASGSEVSLDAATLAALESITVQNGAGGAAVNIQDGGNSITVDAADLDIRDLAFATDKVDVTGSDITATVTATNLDIRDLTHVSDSIKIGDGTDLMAVNSDGSLNVVVVEDPGTEIVNYNTASAVAAAATSNHDYTAPSAGKLFQVLATASGKAKIEVQVETAAASGTFNTVAVAFNSTANPNMVIDLRKHVVIPSGARVRVIRTNKDQQAQDLYSTIIALLN
jgi:hypothetical protein